MSGLVYDRGLLLRLLKRLFPFISPLWEMSVQREHEGMIHVTFVAFFLSLSPPPSIHQMRAVRISMVSRVDADGRHYSRH